MLIYLTLTEQNSFDFEYIYNKYKNLVHAIIFKYVKEKESSAEVMQESFLRLFKTMERLQTEDDVRRWLFKIAKNAALDCIKEESHHKKVVAVYLDDDEMAMDFMDKTAANPLSEALKEELAQEIAGILSTLKPIHADVLRLKYYFGFTVDEIAKLAKVPVHTVYSRLAKARNLVYSQLTVLKESDESIAGGVFKDER